MDLAARGAHRCRLDVSDEEPITQFASQIAETGNVDLLINAAGTDARAFGVAADQRGPFEISAGHFLAEVRVNAAGPMLTTRALLPQLINGTPGKVVNLASRLASMAIFFTIMTAFAELERDIIHERTTAGLAAARAKGRTGGRPTVMDADKLAIARPRQANGESAVQIAKAVGVSRATIYRHLSSQAPVNAPNADLTIRLGQILIERCDRHSLRHRNPVHAGPGSAGRTPSPLAPHRLAPRGAPQASCERRAS